MCATEGKFSVLQPVVPDCHLFLLLTRPGMAVVVLVGKLRAGEDKAWPVYNFCLAIWMKCVLSL